MPDIPGSPPSPRTALFWDGDQWRYALVDNTGHLQIDVLTSGLPAGAATAAAQALALAQLQLIEDMRDALQSVATDRLIVRGEDQLWSFDDTLEDRQVGAISGADGYLDSGVVGDGEIWVIHSLAGRDITTPTTRHAYNIRRAGINYSVHDLVAAIPANQFTTWTGRLVLKKDDFIRFYCVGGLVADQIELMLTGYKMTKEV